MNDDSEFMIRSHWPKNLQTYPYLSSNAEVTALEVLVDQCVLYVRYVSGCASGFVVGFMGPKWKSQMEVPTRVCTETTVDVLQRHASCSGELFCGVFLELNV